MTSDYIYHHGIIGQKWGVRRYQNPDGSLTDAGKKRYNRNYSKDQARGALDYYKKERNKYDKSTKKERNKYEHIIDKALEDINVEIENKLLYKVGHEKEKAKIAAKYMNSKKVIDAETKLDLLNQKASELNSAKKAIEKYIEDYSNKKSISFYDDAAEKYIEEYLRNK